jgi:hypothetical protein
LLPIRARALDSTARSWTICLTPHARRATDLLISARFAHGDLFADVRLSPAHAAPPTDRPRSRSCA